MQYQAKATDWREQLRKNNRKTRWIITMFIGLYLTVGLLVDMFLYAPSFPGGLGDMFYAMSQGYIFPIGTVIMGIIAAVSLLITYSMYDKIMLLGTEYHEVTADSSAHDEKQLFNIVDEMKVAAGLHYMPRVYIIEADYMNAFASGYSEKSAMVAITRGLMQKLTRSEIQAVMAHELSHVRHADIKLTLTVGVLSNIMLIVIDVLFYGVIYGRRSRDGGNRLAIIILVLRFVLPILTVLLSLYLSRTREYMADAGAVELMRDNEPMANALLKIHDDHVVNADYYKEEYSHTAHEDVRRAAYLYDPVMAGAGPLTDVSSFMSTHPSLEQRLKALGFHRQQKS